MTTTLSLDVWFMTLTHIVTGQRSARQQEAALLPSRDTASGKVRGGGSLIILHFINKKVQSQQKQGYGELDLAETA